VASMTPSDRPPLVVVSAGESATSKTLALATTALTVGGGGGGRLIELRKLPADALLGRSRHPDVDEAVAAGSGAAVLVLATPIYRATYSGSLKAFLDLFAMGSLARTAVVLMASAGSPAHFLALDTGGRAVVASLGGWTVPTVVYATPADFTEREPSDVLVEASRTALDQAWSMAAARPQLG
jgi:FMN reductase